MLGHWKFLTNRPGIDCRNFFVEHGALSHQILIGWWNDHPKQGKHVGWSGATLWKYQRIMLISMWIPWMILEMMPSVYLGDSQMKGSVTQDIPMKPTLCKGYWWITGVCWQTWRKKITYKHETLACRCPTPIQIRGASGARINMLNIWNEAASWIRFLVPIYVFLSFSLTILSAGICFIGNKYCFIGNIWSLGNTYIEHYMKLYNSLVVLSKMLA